jgi:hypothetical protein
MATMKSDTVRHYYIDNLRTMVIMLVILLHLAVTYSGLGRWYYNEEHAPELFGLVFFSLFQTFVQGFSMGILFLVAGYFTPGGLQRKGLGRFVKDRWRRLGLPSLFYLLVVTPFICWMELPSSQWRSSTSSFPDFYSGYILSGGMKLLGVGPCGSRWRSWSFRSYTRSCGQSGPGRAHRRRARQWKLRRTGRAHPDRHPGAFLLRLVFPLGTIFWGMQICYFSQYIILFIAGIFAWHTKFHERITPAVGRRWLIAGIVLGFPILFVIKWMAGVYHSPVEAEHMKSAYASVAGGASWFSFSFALWNHSSPFP